MSDTTISAVSEMFTGKAKRRYTEETAPVNGLKFRFQSLLAGEVTRYQSSLVNQKTGKMIRRKLEHAGASLIVLMAVDENDTLLMNNSHVEKMVAEWDYADLAFLSEACTKHAGMDSDEFEDLAKNSGTIQFDNANSGSAEAATE